MHILISLFGTSKYLIWYSSLISKRTQHILECDYEKHHIIPRSLGGSNKTDNIVRLTVREHYIAHLMLYHAAKTAPNKQIYWKQLYSLNAFLIQKRREPFIIPSIIIKKIRDAQKQQLTRNRSLCHNEKQKQAFKNNHWSKLGLEHPMLNKKHSNESKKLMSQNSSKWWCKAVSPEGHVVICRSTRELACLTNTNVDTITKFSNTDAPVPLPGKRYITQSTKERLNAVGWYFYRQLHPFTDQVSL